jgi:hypothetical protein
MSAATKCLGLASFVVLLALPVSAGERCGVWSESAREGEAPARFRLLRDLKAFLDMQTCLVWSLEVDHGALKLTDAVYRCSNLGQGGPGGGAMGWRLPSAAELSSLDGPQWDRQRADFSTHKLPPLHRTETPFWTTTPWPPEPDSWAVVMFSARTTLSHQVKGDATAGAWCVRCCPATGVR